MELVSNCEETGLSDERLSDLALSDDDTVPLLIEMERGYS